MRAMIFIGGMLLGLMAGFFGGREYGRYHQFLEQNELRYEEDKRLLATFLSSDPAFGRLVTLNDKHSGIGVAGYVASQRDYDRLRVEVLRLFGEPRLAFVMRDVSVHASAGPVAAPDRGGK